jgi:hypothetical protein
MYSHTAFEMLRTARLNNGEIDVGD